MAGGLRELSLPSRRLPSGARAASRLKSEQSRSAPPGSAKAGPPLRSGPPSQERGSRAFRKCLPRDADVATEVASQPTRFTAEHATRQLWRVWQRVSVEVTLSAGEEAGHLCAARHCPAPLCAARHCPAPPLPGPAPGIRRRLCLCLCWVFRTHRSHTACGLAGGTFHSAGAASRGVDQPRGVRALGLLPGTPPGVQHGPGVAESSLVGPSWPCPAVQRRPRLCIATSSGRGPVSRPVVLASGCVGSGISPGLMPLAADGFECRLRCRLAGGASSSKKHLLRPFGPF